MKIIFTSGAHTYRLDAERSARGIEIQIDNEHVPVHVLANELPRVTFIYDGVIQTARIVSDDKRRWIHWNGQTLVLERGEATGARAASHEHKSTSSGIVTAPMPGQVRVILTQVGDWVEEGQSLLLLEAMKMEIRVTATCAGQIVQLDVGAGQTVEREQILATIQAPSATDE